VYSAVKIDFFNTPMRRGYIELEMKLFWKNTYLEKSVTLILKKYITIDWEKYMY